MTVFGSCHNPTRTPSPGQLSVPSLAGWQALGSVFGGPDLPQSQRPIVRTGGSLVELFPSPTETFFDVLDEEVELAKAGGWRVYIDPTNCPAWASGGKAAYVSGISGSSCATLVNHGIKREHVGAIYDAALRNDKAAVQSAISAGLQQSGSGVDAQWLTDQFLGGYEGEKNATWCWNDPFTGGGGIHGYGDQPEIDKYSGPRPHLTDISLMPHVDPRAMHYMGDALGARYGDAVDFWGVGNEWDIYLFYMPMKFDGANRAGGPDVVKWIADEWVEPFFEGVRDGMRRALISREPVFFGPEVAYGPTLPRFTAKDSPPAFRRYTALSGHWYPENGWPTDTLLRDGHPFTCSEVDGPSVSDDATVTSIVDWTSKIVTEVAPKISAIIYLAGDRFVDGWGGGGTNVNRTGAEMKKLVQQLGARRRAARH